jgi:hypothetical protein
MRTYCIINFSEVSSVDFDLVLQTSADTLRYSVDGSQALLKYIGDQPSFLSGKQEYTHSEILTVLSGDEWTPDEPPGE